MPISLEGAACDLDPGSLSDDEEVDIPVALAAAPIGVTTSPTSSKYVGGRNTDIDVESVFDSAYIASSKAKRGSTAPLPAKHAASAYVRIMGSKRGKNNTVGEDPKLNSTAFGSFKDRLFSLAAGETVEERKTFKRLEWYKKVLQNEIILTQQSVQRFSLHSKSLVTQFETQEIQLESMGLTEILKPFRMQAWSRVSRSALLEDLALVVEGILKARLERAHKVITEFQEDKLRKNKANKIEDYDAFCLLVQDVLAKDPTFAALCSRLFRMDRVCASSMQAFRPELPQLEPQTFETKKLQLEDIVGKYQKLLDSPEPAQFENGLSWVEFCVWYADRKSKMHKLEIAYASFVEDERQRDGRLLRRWCRMVLESRKPSFSPSGKHSANTEEPARLGMELTRLDPTVTDSDKAEGGQPPAPTAPPAGSMSAKSIKAFVGYYAHVVGKNYGISENLINGACNVLTQHIIYKRICPAVFQYDSSYLREKDTVWCHQCRVLRYADPIVVGVPEEFVYGFKRKNQSEEEVQILTDECIERETAAVRQHIAAEESIQGGDIFKLLTLTGRLEDLARAREISKEKLQQGAPIYGTPYARSSQVFSWLGGAIVPYEICSILLLAQKWLLKDAVGVSKKMDYLGADTLFPITVIALADAGIPNIHQILRFIQQYGNTDQHSGEISYYLTCLQASVEFILRFELPQDKVEKYGLQDPEIKKTLVDETEDIQDKYPSLTAIEGDAEIEKLGEWLRYQETMEDTISILQKEGWMI